MFSWASLASALLKIVASIAGYIRDKQLLDAGKAVQRDADHTETRNRLDRARLAADAERVPDDAEFRD